MTDNQGTRIAIQGVPRYDGEYELDLNRAWTTREWNWIKRISGYMPFTVNEGLRGGDPDLIVALAIIGMVRAQKITREEAMDVAEILLDVPYDGARIQLVVEDTEDDQLPLDLTTPPDESSPNGTASKSSISGSPSTPSSAPSETTPASTGTTASALPDTFDQVTSVRQPQQT